jgi:hypothetical protein
MSDLLINMQTVVIKVTIFMLSVCVIQGFNLKAKSVELEEEPILSQVGCTKWRAEILFVPVCEANYCFLSWHKAPNVS